MAKLIDKERYDLIVKKVINKELAQKEAAFILEITDRQIRRLITKYKENGEDAFVHQNSGKLSHNKKISDELANEIIDNYMSAFSDYSSTHYYEEQGYKYGISFQSMYN